MMLHRRHVDDVAFVLQALFLKAQPHPARSARTPAVVKDHHGHLPKPENPAFFVGSVVPHLSDRGQGPAPGLIHALARWLWAKGAGVRVTSPRLRLSDSHISKTDS